MEQQQPGVAITALTATAAGDDENNDCDQIL